MRPFLPRLAAVALTLWVGGLWVTGYLAVPVLFHAQPDRQLAGLLAGEIFHTMAYVGLACGAILLGCERLSPPAADKTRRYLIVAMLVLGLLIQFGIAPMMADLKARAYPMEVMAGPGAGRFRMLHGVSSIVYLVQSLLGLVLVLRSAAPPRATNLPLAADKNG